MSFHASIQVSDELLNRVRHRARKCGQSVEVYVARVLERELSMEDAEIGEARRVSFPLFPSASPGHLRLTPSDIALVEEDEDLRRLGNAR